MIRNCAAKSLTVWENDKTDERLWYAQVKVASGKNKVGCNFDPKYPIDFNKLDYVRDRAIGYVQEFRPSYNEDKLSKDLEDITKIIFGENPDFSKPKMIECPDCGGAGYEDDPCSECDGNGEIENDEGEGFIECPSCGGSGTEEIECGTCYGDGEVEA